MCSETIRVTKTKQNNLNIQITEWWIYTDRWRYNFLFSSRWTLEFYRPIFEGSLGSYK